MNEGRASNARDGSVSRERAGVEGPDTPIPDESTQGVPVADRAEPYDVVGACAVWNAMRRGREGAVGTRARDPPPDNAASCVDLSEKPGLTLAR